MNILTWFKSLFQKALKLFAQLIKEAFPIAKQIIIGKLSEFGSVVIAELASKDLSGEEKRKAAFETIKAKAEELGGTFTNSLINALIEILVQKYKTRVEGQ